MRRSTFLPLLMVIVIVILTLIAIRSGRSNAPDIAGDSTYPHYVCTFAEYCEGPDCSLEPVSFVLYTEYEDGLPRLEAPRFGTRLTMTQYETHRIYASSGGAVTGDITFYPNREFDFAGSALNGNIEVEHFATGTCDSLVRP
jgi:hypothetical protein